MSKPTTLSLKKLSKLKTTTAFVPTGRVGLSVEGKSGFSAGMSIKPKGSRDPGVQLGWKIRW